MNLWEGQVSSNGGTHMEAVRPEDHQRHPPHPPHLWHMRLPALAARAEWSLPSTAAPAWQGMAKQTFLLHKALNLPLTQWQLADVAANVSRQQALLAVRCHGKPNCCTHS
jgi:hypothetical protein